ncbi:MAG: iron-containing alcohol dehydrogenase [Devosia sp.]|nr:iron-containing alcohol dehydrogenase [Devosia sp.]
MHCANSLLNRGHYRGTAQQIVFGTGAINGLERALQECGISRALLVTGRTVAGTGLVERVRRAAGGCEIVVFDGSRPHAPSASPLAGLAAARQANADGLIALGGSSPVDVAKAISYLNESGAQAFDWNAPATLQGPPHWPIVAVTTTLSQSEFSPLFGVTDEATGQKHVFRCPSLLPAVVFLDAEFTRDTPERLFLSTGVKALDTSIAILLRFTQSQPLCDLLSLEAIAQLWHTLIAVKQTPQDLAMRQQLQLMAWMGMFARQGLPVDESVPRSGPWFGAAARHQFGGHLGLAHGELAGVLLPAALAFHLEPCRARQALLAQRLELGGPEDLAAGISQLVATLGLPATLRDMGVARSALPMIARAMQAEEPGYDGMDPAILSSLELVY